MEKKWYHNERWHIELSQLLEEAECAVVLESMHPDDLEIVNSFRVMFQGDQFVWNLVGKTKKGHPVQLRWDPSRGFQYAVGCRQLRETVANERFARQFKWEVEEADKY